MCETKTGFYHFYEKNKIVIPIIQRDYAQGRRTSKADNVRDNFIKSIMLALKKNEPSDFNFIYGYTGTDGEFYPVDGQQRLTTLYLLHWLIYVKIGEFNDEVMNNGEFTYQTRTSSTEFFSWLQNEKEKIAGILADSTKTFEESIINSSEYQSSWKNDPTVSAAIVMLDSINEKLKNESKEDLKKYWDRLKEEICVIFFQVISEEIAEEDREGNNKSKIRNLTDKTYIRMNARGKELTSFENVKAMIDAIDMKTLKKIIIDNYELYYANHMYKQFSRKISGVNLDLAQLTEITERIDDRSLNSLINILNIASMKEVDGYKWEVDKEKQKKKLSDDSKEIAGKETFYSFFLEVWDSLMYENWLTGSDYRDKFFNGIIYEGDVQSEDIKKLMAKLFYFYLYRNRNSNSEDISAYFARFKENCDQTFSDKMDAQLDKNWKDFLVILNWLNFTGWHGTKNIISNLYTLAEIASSKDDVIQAFAEWNQDINLQPVEIPDLNVRMKEMKIKTQIIVDQNNLFNTADEFTDIENIIHTNWSVDKEEYPKLQFFLWVSGYWDLYSSGDSNCLKTCFEQCKEMFEKGLDYRRVLYAVASSMDFNNNSLLPWKTINENCGENAHLWKDGYFFWNDDEKDSFTVKRETLRNLFKKYSDVCREVNKLENDLNYYPDCWLKYGIIHKGGLLSSELMPVEQSNRRGTIGDILIKSIYGAVYFMLGVYMIKNSGSEYSKTNTLSNKYKRDIVIKAGEEITLHSNPNEKILLDKNHAIHLEAVVSLKYPPNSTISGIQENSVYRIYSRSGQNALAKLEYDPGNPFKLKKYVYDYTMDLDETLANSYSYENKSVMKQIDGYSDDDMKELWINRASRGRVPTKITGDGYQRGVGTSKTWSKVINPVHIDTNDTPELTIDI